MEVFNIPIGIQKILQLKNGRTAIVSHRKTARWISISKKFPKVKKVRFYNQLYDYDVILTIKEIKQIRRLGEDVVEIHVKTLDVHKPAISYENSKTRSVL